MENGEKRLLNDYELRKLGRETFEKMDDETKKLVIDIMFATVSLINSFTPDNPFFLYEAVGWKVFEWEMLGHLKNNEVWHIDDKCWKIADEK